jgi:hypothetical protein
MNKHIFIITTVKTNIRVSQERESLTHGWEETVLLEQILNLI